MKLLETDSKYSLYIDFSLSETDRLVLQLLYLPILKADSCTVYDSLLRSVPFVEKEGFFTHDDLLSDLGFDAARYLKARERLEAIGLLDTFRKEEDGQVLYVYHLLPPASPKKFFKDPILLNLLLQNISQKRFSRLKGFFKVSDTIRTDGYLSVNSDFKDVFSLKLQDSQELDGNSMMDKKYKSLSTFDKDILFDYLKASNVSVDIIQKDLDEIISTCTLYGIDEKKAFELVIRNLDSEENFYYGNFLKDVRSLNKYQRLDEKNKEKAFLGKGNSSKKVKVFSSYTPKEYLQAFFHAEPEAFMLKEIEKIKRNYAFDNGVINVLLDYSLKKTNREFNNIFIEKVASSLSANEISDCYSAMVFLNNRDFELSRKKKSINHKVIEEKAKEENTEDTITKDVLDDISGDLGI